MNDNTRAISIVQDIRLMGMALRRTGLTKSIRAAKELNGTLVDTTTEEFSAGLRFTLLDPGLESYLERCIRLIVFRENEIERPMVIVSSIKRYLPWELPYKYEHSDFEIFFQTVPGRGTRATKKVALHRSIGRVTKFIDRWAFSHYCEIKKAKKAIRKEGKGSKG